MMLHYEFMQNAFVASGVVAILCGLVGWFLVLRGQSFAGHALSHIGFAGATGAVLIGMTPLMGMVLSALAAGLVLGWEPQGDLRSNAATASHRDSVIGLVLAASLGLGLLFLQMAHTPASSATALLFGNVLGVDKTTLHMLVLLGVVSLIGLCFLARPLLFASLDPDLAAAKGVRLRVVACGFMALVALATAIGSRTIGILLVFSLLVGPASCTLRLGLSPWMGLLVSAFLALVLSWGGLVVAWYTGAPVSFCISAGAALCYLLARAIASFGFWSSARS